MIQVNEYFDGTVKSLGYESPEGKSTIGVMEKGEYEFNTSQKEYMTVIEGELVVLLPEATAWKSFKKNETFSVDAHLSFKVKANEQSSYLCKYA
ncbi:Putative cytoplasmic protein [Arcticibacter svalbardensis MN12-7]|uniref:Pyrimidine/purine nucleoside phosphorylase n=1 Tax=Arcticibacter svalbardensis MN12-7 TaxID=1150600 RepID=R9GV60_9SPHI|nr:pyrimidine/purine nucleoside phosphorylase [Arcticibacter svalbardensis]EOR95717.1 Putative cytoplasmic protein [Arcticibacter svalbardensis MN12-7]